MSHDICGRFRGKGVLSDLDKCSLILGRLWHIMYGIAIDILVERKIIIATIPQNISYMLNSVKYVDIFAK